MFRDAYTYTPTLSGFVKIGQMLVIQRAVVAVDEGEVDQPSDILNEMRERFMIHGSASPMGWALRLRTYGKRIRKSSTVVPGHVDWSEDVETIFYKNSELNMADFRNFVHHQVWMAESQLKDLLQDINNSLGLFQTSSCQSSETTLVMLKLDGISFKIGRIINSFLTARDSSWIRWFRIPFSEGSSSYAVPGQSFIGSKTQSRDIWQSSINC
ncbi:hypothetical protein BZG36_02823 [Bifiguratus adelaidae]|uniref:Uncharacterized protein n=1 Tax=Bifiguratus adelaidae TaxID=1938954 RepID=A0A261Y0U6_9FUNG|nr:hypothetical protein BZG36_02823 [Bifiguratus adelaidae]